MARAAKKKLSRKTPTRKSSPRSNKPQIQIASATCACAQNKQERFQAYALLCARIVLGLFILIDGAYKVLNLDAPGTILNGLGYGWVVPIIGAAEVIMGALLILGMGTRWASSCIAGFLILICIDIVLQSGQSLGFVSIALPLLGVTTAFVLLASGPGARALDYPPNN